MLASDSTGYLVIGDDQSHREHSAVPSFRSGSDPFAIKWSGGISRSQEHRKCKHRNGDQCPVQHGVRLPIRDFARGGDNVGDLRHGELLEIGGIRQRHVLATDALHRRVEPIEALLHHRRCKL